MRVTADTNVLVRVVTEDDASQAGLARAALEKADVVAVSAQALCEFAWVLSRGYRLPAQDIAREIRVLINSANVAVERGVIEAGLAMLDEGADFADGIIAFEGARLGAGEFISFDRRAVTLLEKRGIAARLLT